jgi:hypothetical protein
VKSSLVALIAAYSLGPSALAQAPLYDLASAVPGEQRGTSVVGLGDVDGDGFGDLAVGAEFGAGAQPSAGCVYVYSGRTGQVIRTLGGERTNDRFGHSIARLDDVDGDGFDDLVVGAPEHEWTAGTNRGAVYVYSSATAAQLGKLGGNADGDKVGWCVTGVPDVNGDGIGDYAFSKPWGDSGGKVDCGVVYVYSGASPTSFLRSYVGAASGDHFGYSIAGIADQNNDGKGDLLIGAPQADAAGIFDSGRGYVVSGSASGTTLTTFSGGTTAGWFAHSVAALPDITGDGEPEPMFGEPFVSPNGVGSGRIRAYSSSNGAIVRTIVGNAGDELGWKLAGLEDFDGDGKGDILAGSPASEWGTLTNAGLARVYSGATGALLAAMTGYHDDEGFGAAVGDAGDINADGFHDAIAGSPKYDLNATDAGRGRVILGNAPFPTNYCTAKVNSQGCTPTIGIGGCASYTVGDNLMIVGANVLPLANGIMIWSPSQNAAPFHGGYLCVGPPVRRTPVQTSTDNTGSPYPCDGIYIYHFSQAQMANEGMLPGSTFYAQYWSRDSGFTTPNNVGLTNGVSIEVLP